MKLLLIPLFILSFHFTQAKEPIVPCGNYNQCSPQQQKIVDQFDLINEFSAEAFTTRVYSGACYYSSRNHQNTHAHYAYIYFDWVDGEPRFVGSFSFFANPNPYKDYTPGQVWVEKGDDLNHKKRTLNLSSTSYAYAYFPAEDPLNDIHYWFKTQQDKLYLYGYWHRDYRFVCELTKNSLKYADPF